MLLDCRFRCTYPMSIHVAIRFIRPLLCAFLASGGYLHAVELRGLIDLRVGTSDAAGSFTRDGLGKTRTDGESGNLRLGQAFLRVDGELLDSVSAMMVVSANDDRRGLLDINEAWLGWNPVPRSPWKIRAKFGAFFPTTNLEIDYDSVGWTPVRTISSSAINSWIGEEFRTQGIEFSMTRKGNLVDSSHDFGFSAAMFGRNDPAGSLLAWRGWSISDRISGITESIRLADLPVYRPSGALPLQNRSLRIAREIDHRVGYYAGAHYAHESWLRVDAMHYDNRGDPRVVKNGQYSWNTRFDHLGLRLLPGDDWTWLIQAMRGETTMGDNAVRLRYDAWYALLSHPLGVGNLTLRADRFRAQELVTDTLPSDPNSEHGRALALAYAWPINSNLSMVAEALEVRSQRRARLLIGSAPGQTERSLTVALRWQM